MKTKKDKSVSVKKIAPRRGDVYLRYVTAIYVILLSLLLWLPDPRVLIFGWDLGEGPEGHAHVITFSILAFLVEMGRREKSLFFWMSMLIFYTFLTEIVQHFLPIRSFEISDIIQDFSGILTGLWFGMLVRRIPFTRQENTI